MPPNQIASASTLIVVSFRDASINSIKEYFFGMGVLKVEQISGRLTLQAVLHREELPLVDAATCSAFQVLFSSSAKGIDLALLDFVNTSRLTILFFSEQSSCMSEHACD
jgi:hypothetical protein